MKFTADKLKTFKDTSLMECPKCGAKVNMNFIQSSLGFGVMGIPVKNYKYDLYTLCPECQALFAVADDVAKDASEEKKLAYSDIEPKDLIFLKQFPYKA